MNKHEYHNVYASYAVTPRSEALLQQFSREIITILQAYPMEHKPDFKVPSQFHITADYKWTVTNIDEYIKTITKRKKNWSQFIECNGIWTWKSNTNGNDIIYITPTWDMPYQHGDIHNTPHLTAVEMVKPDNTFLTWFWLCAITNIMDAWSELWDEWPFVPIGINTAKIQIWWTQNSEKKMIIEV